MRLSECECVCVFMCLYIAQLLVHLRMDCPGDFYELTQDCKHTRAHTRTCALCLTCTLSRLCTRALTPHTHTHTLTTTVPSNEEAATVMARTTRSVAEEPYRDARYPSRSLSLALSLALSLSLSLSLSRARALSLSHAVALALARAHARARALSLSLSPSL